MQLTATRSTGSISEVYQALGASSRPRNANGTSAANFADSVNISPAARERLQAESGARAVSVANFDTDKGEVALDMDSYFSGKPASRNAELPPLLMPSQRNIDMLTQHLNQVFPAFLSANGIPAAPASIEYDSYGQPQFPADYPYGAQLKQALQDNPGMANELGTVKSLSEFKNLLDESQPFQQAYSAAGSQGEVNAVVARYASLLSGNTSASHTALLFDKTGKLSIGKPAGA